MKVTSLLFTLLYIFTCAGTVFAQDNSMQFDYFYRENKRTTLSSDSSERSDYLLSRGGKLEAYYYLVADVEYTNRMLKVIEGDSEYSNLGRLYSGSLVLPLEYMFFRVDQNIKDYQSYLDTPALGLEEGTYYFDDRTKQEEKSQSLGLRIPSWNVDLGVFQGSTTEKRDIIQSVTANDISYEIDSCFTGYHFQKRPVDFDSFYMGILYRNGQSNDISGTDIAAGAEQFYRVAKGSIGWGFQSGSRLYYSSSKRWDKKDFSFITSGNAIFDETTGEGYNYGALITFGGQAMRIEKKVKTQKMTFTSPTYYSVEDFRTVGLTIGFRYDVELELTLELASEFHKFNKSTDILDLTKREYREFADDTLGVGFLLSFY